jgi:undecaprenyl diphosphate synthase
MFRSIPKTKYWAEEELDSECSIMKRSCLLIGLLQFLWSCTLSINAWARAPMTNDALERCMKAQVDRNNLPEHIAIIMDGNGRWAIKQDKSRVFGHQNAIKGVREVVECCGELDIPYLTLYAFSTENWKRPEEEVQSLMRLIITTIDEELEELVQNNVRLNFIGDLPSLPERCQKTIQKATQASCHNQGLLLTIALSYGGRWDLAEAAKAIAREVQAGSLVPQDIDDALFKQYLATKDMPDPSLLIRTGGEMRLSNFLLGQLAYTELFFTPVLWPDFRKHHLYEAILAYQKRERRFGG